MVHFPVDCVQDVQEGSEHFRFQKHEGVVVYVALQEIFRL
jgi:hypothetical protein